MPFREYKTLKYFSFSSLGEGIRHGIFTRHGGMSPTPWNSLNMGGTVGDDLSRVKKNRKAAFEALELDFDRHFDSWQVHGTNVIMVKAPRLENEPYQKADAILTDQPGLTLMMRFADCVPIILHDPLRKIVGLVHAGWKGTVYDIAGTTLRAMKNNYGCEPKNILACIGPSIGPDHYIVDEDVATIVRDLFGDGSSILQKSNDGKYHFDLWQANRFFLERCGVDKIEVAGICTACHLEDWFSFRAEKGLTGRFGALVSLGMTNDK